jgi:hypothetical protein
MSYKVQWIVESNGSDWSHSLICASKKQKLFDENIKKKSFTIDSNVFQKVIGRDAISMWCVNIKKFN